MNKKNFFKFLTLAIIVFALSGCSVADLNLDPGSKKIVDKVTGKLAKPKAAPASPSRPTTTTPVVDLKKPASSTVSSTPSVSLNKPSNNDSSLITYSAASGISEKMHNYEINKDYQLVFSEDYFFAKPEVIEIGCDFYKNCPCLSLRGLPIEEYCQSSSVERKVVSNREFCVQERSGVAAGSTYNDYYFTLPLKGSTDRCVTLYFTKRLVSDCQVYGSNEKAVAQCEQEKVDAPSVIENVVSSFKLLP